MKKGFLLVILLFLLGSATVRAQAFFSTDKATFFDELTAYLNTSTSKQDRDEAAAMMQQQFAALTAQSLPGDPEAGRTAAQNLEALGAGGGESSITARARQRVANSTNPG